MSVLIKSISDSDTVLMYTVDASFPEDNGVIQIGSEIIVYTSSYMGTLYGCTRGAKSTTAVSHSSGSVISLIDFFSAPSGGGDAVWSASANIASLIPPLDTIGLLSEHISFDTGNQTILLLIGNLSGSGQLGLYANANGSGPSVYLDTLVHLGFAGTDSIQADDDGTAGNTRMLLYDVDSGSIQRVSVGAADSGGTGFKVLRIPN